MKMKSGVPYESFRDKLRPFDCVFFCGGDFVSSTIRYIERQRLGAGEFSHVGVIVTSDVLDHPNIVPGRRYILESTATGLLGCGVKNIDGKAAFCVQITDFDALVEAYDRSSRTRIAVAHVADAANPINLLGVAEAKRRTQDFWERMRGRSYQFNLCVSSARVHDAPTYDAPPQVFDAVCDLSVLQGRAKAGRATRRWSRLGFLLGTRLSILLRTRHVRRRTLQLERRRPPRLSRL